MSKHFLATAVAAAIGLIGCGDASAASNRAWVSGRGVDQVGCGAPTTPCRSLQYVHDHIIAAGGEIDILDPAGYGAITITKAISIVNDGVGTAGVQATSGGAITINAGPTDSVYLRGLNIDGVQFTGATGIAFNLGGSLTVVNCVVRHFSGAGIAVSGAGPVTATISNTIVAENHGDGVAFTTPGTGTGVIDGFLDQVLSSQNQNGFSLDIHNASTAGTHVTIANSVADSNGVDGVFGTASNPGGATMLVDNSYLRASGVTGLALSGTMVVSLTRSVINVNGVYGVDNQINPGFLLSPGNNWISNATNFSPTSVAITVLPLQ